jgi:hypothetical protein
VPPPTIGPELPNLGYEFLIDETHDQKCRDYTNFVTAIYPVNTGSKALDNILAFKAKKFLQKYLDYKHPACGNPIGLTVSEFLMTFEAHSPGKNYLSILEHSMEFPAGYAHPWNRAKANIFDLRTARVVKINQIFPNPKYLPILWETMYWRWCQLGFGTIPDHYDVSNHSCDGRPPSPPMASPQHLDVLGQVYLVPEGMIIRLDPPYHRSAGPQKITINIGELQNMGANMEFWE